MRKIFVCCLLSNYFEVLQEQQEGKSSARNADYFSMLE
jgi:hypothetical protein